MYQSLGDEIYLKECYCFAKATYDTYIQDKVKECVDPQRKVKGTPDTPYSLMEGMGGTLCFYYDLLSGNMCFPGYEIGLFFFITFFLWSSTSCCSSDSS